MFGDHSNEIIEIALGQQELIHDLRDEQKRMALEYCRNTRDLIVKFRVVLENPELDVRDQLDAAIRDLDDEVARREEHLV